VSKSELQALHQQIAVCKKCILHKSRVKAVPGVGPERANIMFIGEAPGFHENQQGLPFVGAAGKFLDELLEKIDLRREDVFITNVVKCRPPNNRDPLPSEVAACSHFLERQIETIDPRMIVTLGRFSMERTTKFTRVKSFCAIAGGQGAFVFVKLRCSHLYASVMFSGRVTLLEDRDERWHALELMTRQLDSDAERLIEARKPESLDNTVVGRIDIEYMTGKKSEEIQI